VRDHACPDCQAEGVTSLIHTHSKRCQRHTGQHFSKSTCTLSCQRVHERCRRCGRLCGGNHFTSRRDGLCWRADGPSCWIEALARRAGPCYDAICLLCGRVAGRDMLAGPGLSCGVCRGGLVLQPRQDQHAQLLRPSNSYAVH